MVSFIILCILYLINNKKYVPGMQPGKRKLSAAVIRSTRVRQPAYFLPELAHVVAAADERVPFVNLAQEVSSIQFFLLAV